MHGARLNARVCRAAQDAVHVPEATDSDGVTGVVERIARAGAPRVAARAGDALVALGSLHGWGRVRASGRHRVDGTAAARAGCAAAASGGARAAPRDGPRAASDVTAAGARARAGARTGVGRGARARIGRSGRDGAAASTGDDHDAAEPQGQNPHVSHRSECLGGHRPPARRCYDRRRSWRCFRPRRARC